MNIKYYNVSVISDNSYNVFHDFINKYNKAIILEAEIGKPMWFCYYLEDDIEIPWHRVQTSLVKNITENDICLTSMPPQYKKEIIIETENSIYRFEG